MDTKHNALYNKIEEKIQANFENDIKYTWVLKYVVGSGVTQTLNVDSSTSTLRDALAQLPHGARFVGASHQIYSSVQISEEASTIWTEVLGRGSTAVHTGIGG